MGKNILFHIACLVLFMSPSRTIETDQIGDCIQQLVFRTEMVRLKTGFLSFLVLYILHNHGRGQGRAGRRRLSPA